MTGGERQGDVSPVRARHRSPVMHDKLMNSFTNTPTGALQETPTPPHCTEFRVGALLRVTEDEASSVGRLAWGSVPHEPGTAITLDLVWEPDVGLDVLLSSNGPSLDGFVTALRGTHEMSALSTPLPPVEDHFEITEISTVRRQGLVVDPTTASPPSYVPDLTDWGTRQITLLPSCRCSRCRPWSGSWLRRPS
jgi:hypothetical protein